MAYVMGRVTTTDIADKLGISRGTVSKALNGKNGIDEATRLLVQQTAGEMGYKRAAVALYDVAPVGGKTLSIMVRDKLFADAYWSVFTKGFEAEAKSKNFIYTINTINEEDEATRMLPGSFATDPPAGIVTIGPITEAYYRRVRDSMIPAVYVDTTPNINDAEIFGDTLFSCNREHVLEMTSHLIAQGHKKLGFIGGDVNSRSFCERRLGFYDALAAAGLSVDERFMFGVRDGEVYETVRPWIASLGEYPTAFICANDLYAMVVRSSLNEMGLDVPHDIALCGYDNAPYTPVLFPELTTVDSCVGYMGKRAMQELFWRQNNPDAPYEVIKVTSSVYYRNSTEGFRFP